MTPIEMNDDFKLAKSVAVVDLWDIDDRINRLEAIAERLEEVVGCLVELYRSERVKNWELILQEMLKKEAQKKGNGNVRRFNK